MNLLVREHACGIAECCMSFLFCSFFGFTGKA